MRLTRDEPSTVTPFCSPPPRTVAPSSLEVRFALHAISIWVLPRTATRPFKQYQPFGFMSLSVDFERTVTFGLINTSSGLSVVPESSISPPVPKTPNFAQRSCEKSVVSQTGVSSNFRDTFESRRPRLQSRQAPVLRARSPRDQNENWLHDVTPFGDFGVFHEF